MPSCPTHRTIEGVDSVKASRLKWPFFGLVVFSSAILHSFSLVFALLIFNFFAPGNQTSASDTIGALAIGILGAPFWVVLSRPEFLPLGIWIAAGTLLLTKPVDSIFPNRPAIGAFLCSGFVAGGLLCFIYHFSFWQLTGRWGTLFHDGSRDPFFPLPDFWAVLHSGSLTGGFVAVSGRVIRRSCKSS